MFTLIFSFYLLGLSCLPCGDKEECTIKAGTTISANNNQEKYNQENGITPTTIIKSIDATLVTAYEADYFKIPLDLDEFAEYSQAQLTETLARTEMEMREAAHNSNSRRRRNYGID